MANQTVFNLTMPISPYLPVGSVYAWESPFITEPIATLERNGANLFFISMGSGTGTHLRTPGYCRPGAAGVLDVSLDELVSTQTLVVRIPKAAGQGITRDDVEDALEGLDGWTDEALLIATGWGDDERWLTLGEVYALDSPYFTRDAAGLLAERLRAHGARLLLTDCAHLDQASSHARPEWAQLAPWLRPGFPSPQAGAYVRHYERPKAEDDWPATRALTCESSVVVALAGCEALTEKRIQISVLPMFVEDVAEAPCTVVAEVG